MPESNKEFWRNKLIGNTERDKKNLIKLKKLGWKVIIIWECQLKNIDELRTSLQNLKQFNG